ncbi:uncharacterized protein LOC144432778 [Glandiceps talaboti]
MKSQHEYFKSYRGVPTNGIIGLVLIIFVFIGFVCETYSVDWLRIANTDDTKLKMVGLWQTCDYSVSSTVLSVQCFAYRGVPVYLGVSRAAMVMASIGCIGAFICVIIGLKMEGFLLRLAGAFLAFSGLLVAIAVIVFPVMFNDRMNKGSGHYCTVGWTLISAIASCIFCWLGAILLFIKCTKPRYSAVNTLPEESKNLLYQKY